jgi:hypothetical protein
MNAVAHVGVAQFEIAKYVDTYLKRYALFFDKIKVLNTSIIGAATAIPNEEIAMKIRNALPWFGTISFLESEDFVYLSKPSEWTPSAESKLSPDEASLYRAAAIKASLGSLINLVGTYAPELGEADREQIKAGVFSSWVTRFETLHMRLFENCDAVSIGDLLAVGQEEKSVDRVVSRDDLYEIIISGIPIARDNVPWTDILSFRAEAASQQQQRALRLWISEVTNGKLSFGEAVDRIEYLKDEYRSHMKGAGIKTGTATLKTIVVGTAELIESAFKLKLKALAELPFRVIESKAELMEAERNAPGRPLAYVVRAEDAFS